jgi:uncharacterized protein YcfJ
MATVIVGAPTLSSFGNTSSTVIGGTRVGDTVGNVVGTLLGILVGFAVGTKVGESGDTVGRNVGCAVGAFEGALDTGDRVGGAKQPKHVNGHNDRT